MKNGCLPVKASASETKRSVPLVSGGARPLVHAAFWSATLVFFVLYFGREADSYLQSILFVALLLPVAMATTYFLTGILVPRYLLPGRFRLFGLYAVYTLIASIYLELVVMVASFILLAKYEIAAMAPASLDVFGLVVGLYVVVLLGLAANLAMRWHRLRVEHDAAERARLEAELELREAELASLKTQMQPHFLFNTLNNLYGLTLERSDEAPNVVLRISEMLDYVLYGSERPLVPLSGEVKHLEAYLDLERLRCGQRVEIRFDVEMEDPSAYVAPLLLAPFVENSFKHGASRTAGTTWVHIGLRTAGGELVFDVENGKPGRSAFEQPRTLKPGIGIGNVRRRLRLLYPDAHELRIDETAERYAVRLRMPTHPCSTAPLQEETL